MLLAIISGIILYMAIGMLYYSPLLFGEIWVRLLKIDQPEHPRYGLLTFVTIMTVLLTYFLLHLTNASTLIDGLIVGLGLGVVVSLAYAKDFIFGLGIHTENAFKVYLIGVGYHLFSLPVIGLVMMFFI
ncbi:DUF1761 domain-containing protein [Alkalibacillus silvisoli]|uniref:DUF1761 domain-containing protein n=1 Tax=Alkalibacillus silvisoli TaxID=392823 RepID=A0ABP3JTN8_9BACI